MDSIVKPQLLSGERVIWTGKPYSGLIIRSIDIFLIPFSLLWTGFAIFWNMNAWNTDAAFSFKLFGLPFLVIGAYMVIGRFLCDIILRQRITYFITNERVIIQKGTNRSKTTSLNINHLPSLELNEQRDGFGSIRFGPTAGWFVGNNFGIWQPTFDPTPQFIRIENARSVYQIIQNAPGR